ncbi:hypothetical protein [Vaginisenegalia massiliensis]|uniref:hypothetical protein n=1 Tax=Vaginisenegalia massiliensis TaxID=2058294 RepID=UPI000F53E9FF|nr:hypothetical protein [Vaginisenegalia massiliensis]
MITALRKTERQKYSLIQFGAVYLIITGVVVGISLISLKQGIQNKLIWFSIMDSFAFIQLIIAPLLIASLYSLCVQVEAKHNMWKVIKSSGASLKSLYTIKFWYIQKQLILLYTIQIGLLLVAGKVFGIQSPLPWTDIAIFYLGVLLINFALSSIHYYLSLKFENPLIGLAAAVFGSLTGIGITLISKMVGYLIPYSWYSILLRIEHIVVNGEFTKKLSLPSFYPLIAGLLLGLIFYYLGKQVEVEA